MIVANLMHVILSYPATWTIPFDAHTGDGGKPQ